MPSHFKTTKHIIFVDCDYLTSLWVSQVPRSPKSAIFRMMLTTPPLLPTTTDKSTQTDYFTPCACARGNTVCCRKEPNKTGQQCKSNQFTLRVIVCSSVCVCVCVCVYVCKQQDEMFHLHINLRWMWYVIIEMFKRRAGFGFTMHVITLLLHGFLHLVNTELHNLA